MVFDTVPSTALNKCGEKDVRVKTTGGEKKRYTTVLSVSVAGEFLPTMVIFRGKRDPKDVEIPRGWVVCFNDKAWVRDVMILWVKELPSPYTQSPSDIRLCSLWTHSQPISRPMFVPSWTESTHIQLLFPEAVQVRHSL